MINLRCVWLVWFLSDDTIFGELNQQPRKKNAIYQHTRQHNESTICLVCACVSVCVCVCYSPINLSTYKNSSFILFFFLLLLNGEKWCFYSTYTTRWQKVFMTSKKKKKLDQNVLQNGDCKFVFFR